MSTNKQALRECFEKWWEINYHNGKPPRFGWEYWRDGEGYQIDDDESELDGMWESWQAAHSEKLEAAEKRIAELEARTLTVNLPDGCEHDVMAPVAAFMYEDGYEFDQEDYTAVAGRVRSELETVLRRALRAAGISVKGE